MLRNAVRTALRRGVPSVGGLPRLQCRAMCSSKEFDRGYKYKDPVNTTGYEPAPKAYKGAMTLQDQIDQFPDLVAEEAKTGEAMGLPAIRESQLWNGEVTLMPERNELWWDDGTAEPEWFVDRNWPVSLSTAAMQLFGAFAVIFTVGFTYANLLAPRQQVAPRWQHLPFDMSREFGGCEGKNGMRKAELNKLRAKGELEEDEEEEE